MYKQNGQRETDITKAVDAAMEASIEHYDALAGADSLHTGQNYLRVISTFSKLAKAHKEFLAKINVRYVAPPEPPPQRRGYTKGACFGRTVKSVTKQAARRNRQRGKIVLDSDPAKV